MPSRGVKQEPEEMVLKITRLKTERKAVRFTMGLLAYLVYFGKLKMSFGKMHSNLLRFGKYKNCLGPNAFIVLL